MPNTNYIATLLEIKDLIVENIENSDTEMHLYFTLQRRPHECPHCKALTEQIHDYRTSIIKDIPILGKRTFLHYKKRRYHCSHCNKHFYENFTFLPKYYRITTRLALSIIQLSSNRQSANSVADLVGVSVSTVFRMLNHLQYPKPATLPKTLSIDEFRGNAGGEKFQAILTDPKNHTLVDILPDRKQATLAPYFQSFSNKKEVEYFVMDMNRAYRDLARTYFPNAKIVIDKFHVARYANWALENVRKRIQKQLHPEKRRYFKRSRKLLLSRRSKLKAENIDALAIILQQSSDLATAYYLKELFYVFMDSQSREDASRNLRNFILAAELSELQEFNACLTMLRNWSTYILNAFDCPYTNGYTEGVNNAIKVIKRNAFGYRNFNNFRNKIFLACTK